MRIAITVTAVTWLSHGEGYKGSGDRRHGRLVSTATVGRSDSVKNRRRFGPHTFDQRVSHFDDTNEIFQQRYWYDATFYKEGGPVYLLDGGETDGEDRIPFLETGILRILAEATGGLGLILEHRYYGESFPVANLSTDSLRFLTTEQSLYDSAHFARTVVLPGLDRCTLSNAPWIYYGGSYAGAKSAFARKLFPSVFWGAIASSAVTTAVLDFHNYYTPIMEHGPTECIERLVEHTSLIDSILALETPFLTSRLKEAFGLGNITADADFVNALAIPLGSWQARNWDPAVGSTRFFKFCDAITVGNSSSFAAVDLPSLPKDPRKALESFQGYASYVKEHVAALCPPDATQDECFGTDEYGGNDLEDAAWKSWAYQFCTEWGYFIGHGPDPDAPSIVSRLLDTEYTSKICRLAFPDGELNSVPSVPNVTAVNQYGGYKLSYPRLAFIDGSEDPWLHATPHSPLAPHHGRRPDTLNEPFKLIPGGVHHWDQNGSSDLKRSSEPKAIRRVHEEELAFVKQWIRIVLTDNSRWIHKDKRCSARTLSLPQQELDSEPEADPTESASGGNDRSGQDASTDPFTDPTKADPLQETESALNENQNFEEAFLGGMDFFDPNKEQSWSAGDLYGEAGGSGSGFAGFDHPPEASGETHEERENVENGGSDPHDSDETIDLGFDKDGNGRLSAILEQSEEDDLVSPITSQDSNTRDETPFARGRTAEAAHRLEAWRQAHLGQLQQQQSVRIGGRLEPMLEEDEELTPKQEEQAYLASYPEDVHKHCRDGVHHCGKVPPARQKQPVSPEPQAAKQATSSSARIRPPKIAKAIAARSRPQPNEPTQHETAETDSEEETTAFFSKPKPSAPARRPRGTRRRESTPASSVNSGSASQAPSMNGKVSTKSAAKKPTLDLSTEPSSSEASSSDGNTPKAGPERKNITIDLSIGPSSDDDDDVPAARRARGSTSSEAPSSGQSSSSAAPALPKSSSTPPEPSGTAPAASTFSPTLNSPSDAPGRGEPSCRRNRRSKESARAALAADAEKCRIEREEQEELEWARAKAAEERRALDEKAAQAEAERKAQHDKQVKEEAERRLSAQREKEEQQRHAAAMAKQEKAKRAAAARKAAAEAEAEREARAAAWAAKEAESQARSGAGPKPSDDDVAYCGGGSSTGGVKGGASSSPSLLPSSRPTSTTTPSARNKPAQAAPAIPDQQQQQHAPIRQNSPALDDSTLTAKNSDQPRCQQPEAAEESASGPDADESSREGTNARESAVQRVPSNARPAQAVESVVEDATLNDTAKMIDNADLKQTGDAEGGSPSVSSASGASSVNPVAGPGSPPSGANHGETSIADDSLTIDGTVSGAKSGAIDGSAAVGGTVDEPGTVDQAGKQTGIINERDEVAQSGMGDETGTGDKTGTVAETGTGDKTGSPKQKTPAIKMTTRNDKTPPIDKTPASDKTPSLDSSAGDSASAPASSSSNSFFAGPVKLDLSQSSGATKYIPRSLRLHLKPTLFLSDVPKPTTTPALKPTGAKSNLIAKTSLAPRPILPQFTETPAHRAARPTTGPASAASSAGTSAGTSATATTSTLKAPSKAVAGTAGTEEATSTAKANGTTPTSDDADRRHEREQAQDRSSEQEHRIEQERIEQERIEKEHAEKRLVEQKRVEQDRRERGRREKERMESRRQQEERGEEERIETEHDGEHKREPMQASISLTKRPHEAQPDSPNKRRRDDEQGHEEFKVPLARLPPKPATADHGGENGPRWKPIASAQPSLDDPRRARLSLSGALPARPADPPPHPPPPPPPSPPAPAPRLDLYPTTHPSAVTSSSSHIGLPPSRHEAEPASRSVSPSSLSLANSSRSATPAAPRRDVTSMSLQEIEAETKRLKLIREAQKLQRQIEEDSRSSRASSRASSSRASSSRASSSRASSSRASSSRYTMSSRRRSRSPGRGRSHSRSPSRSRSRSRSPGRDRSRSRSRSPPPRRRDDPLFRPRSSEGTSSTASSYRSYTPEPHDYSTHGKAYYNSPQYSTGLPYGGNSNAGYSNSYGPQYDSRRWPDRDFDSRGYDPRSYYDRDDPYRR